jgi:Divergent InlB B-repeat domain
VLRTRAIVAAALTGTAAAVAFLVAFVAGAGGVGSATDVTLQVAPRGLGSVSANPPGRNSDGQPMSECARNYAQHACEWRYARGTTVTLTANPDLGTGRALAAWSTTTCPGTAACTIVLGDDATSLVALFTPLRLAVRLSDPAAGAVTTDPAGAACRGVLKDPTPNLCREFPARTRVQLTVHVTAPHTFREWSPGCTSVAPDSCAITVLDEATWVGVSFDDDRLPVLPTTIRINFRLRKQGAGGGRVTAEDIDCGSRCGAKYDFGTWLTLTAGADRGSFFDGWKEDVCARTTTRCRVPVGPVTEVVARFGRPPRTPASLRVTKRTRKSITIAWRPRAGGTRAARYRVYANGNARAKTAKTRYTLRGLRCGRRYTIAVAALDARGHRSPKARTRGSTRGCGRR